MKHIDSLYAWICQDTEDGEGIPGMFDPSTATWLPTIGSDLARIECFRETAMVSALTTQRPVVLVRFGQRQLIETIDPFLHQPPGRRN